MTITAFLIQQVDGLVLLEIQEEDLKQMKVANMHLKKFQKVLLIFIYALA